MKIKDIRQFRSFYKTGIRKTKDENRDENFIGAEIINSEGESVFGFFDLYHGDKVKEVVGGIKGFLEGFLEMAQDAQAVYEFMQNAVDSDSSHFTMVWGEDDDQCDYLLVLNNGKQFDFASIRSILNVGVSTKKPEDHTIGKFGIGFKLAHRLVGKDNGINELLNKNYGPILYSWQNSDVQYLLNPDIQEVRPTSQEYISQNIGGEQKITIIGEEPWLFKILITNFPTQPDEVIRDAYYNEVNNALTNEDVNKLRKWLIKYKNVIPLDDYKTGSLFFLKLGEDKSIKLDDRNLREGIRFSLSILNKVSGSAVKGLDKVHLNGYDIENAPLLFEDFIIDKSTTQYRYIRFGKTDQLNESELKIAEKDSNIQLLFGYTDYKTAFELINNVPNFYLFFPLSEEKHRLKFILHSNAFYKKSARTSLHSDPINERLLETFANLIIDKLSEWGSSTNNFEREKFLMIYPVLLLSQQSDDHDRAWINKPLVQILHKFIKNNIPVSSAAGDGFELVTFTESVKIRSSKIPVDSSIFGLDIKWFYWGKDDILNESVRNIIGIKEFNILDLLSEKNIALKINQLLQENPEIRSILLDEIDEHISSITGSSPSTEIFKDNFHDIRLFEFDNGDFKSINDLKAITEEPNFLLLFEEIESIKDLITKAGFICTKESLSKYQHIQGFIRIRQSIFYNDYKILNEYLSTGFGKTNYNVSEKNKICQTLEKAKEKESELERNQRMHVLRLFANEQSDIVPLNSLLLVAPKPWLKPFEISKLESQEYLHRYLITTYEEAYTKVIIPLWDNVIADKQGLIRKDTKAFYSDIIALQEATKQTQTLSNKVFIPTETQFLAPSNNIFYQPDWVELNLDDYKSLSMLFKKLFNLDLPLQEILPFLKDAPFSLSTSNFSLIELRNSIEIVKDEISILGKAFELGKMPLFDRFIIDLRNSVFSIRIKKEHEKAAWCGNDSKAVEAYIQSFHKELLICPDIIELKGLIFLKEKELAQYFIEKWDGINETISDSLSEVIVSQDDNVKILYLKKCGPLALSLNDFSGYNKLKNAVKVSLSFTDLMSPNALLQSVLTLKIDETLSFTLRDVISSSSESIHFGDANEYHLRLSEIFTNEETGYSKHIETIIGKLYNDYQYDRSRLGVLFNLKESESKNDIKVRIDSSFQKEGYLINASQVCFILLYKKYYFADLDLSSYLIKSGESIIRLTGTFAVSREMYTLFKCSVYIDNIYDGLSSILKLSTHSPLFKLGELSLYTQPVIENSTLLGPDLREGLMVAEQIELLDFLLVHNRTSSPLNSHGAWDNIFGFNPKIYVSAKYALKAKEALPEHIFVWSRHEKNDEKKKSKALLLSALGFNLPWSLINTLREVLLDQNSVRPFNVSDIDNISVELLANTLELIKFENSSFKITQSCKFYDVFKALVKRCIQHSLFNVSLPINGIQIHEYILSNEGSVYYYDNDKYHEFYKHGVSIQEIISATSIQVYDATNWEDSQDMKSSLQEIIITEKVDDILVQNMSEEWSDLFYSEWKSKFPETSIYYLENLPVQIFVNDRFVKAIRQDKFYSNGSNIYCPRKYSYHEIFETIKNNNWLNVEAADTLVLLYNANQMRVIELLNSPIIDDDIRKIVEDKKNELQEIAHRKELRESLSQNLYSYRWFLDFIEIQTLKSLQAEKSTPEQEISFFGAEWEPGSDRLIRFKDPNRTVTPTIEYCTDFSAIFHFNNKKPLEVKIQDVSKKGQVVLAMLSRPKELNNSNLANLKRIDLKFSRTVNLLNRLLNAFIRLGDQKEWEDTYNLKDNLTSNIKFIYGPPGTGKTTTIAERLNSLMQINPNAKVLVLTPTNKAADVLTERIIAKSIDGTYWLVRYGATFSNLIIEKGLLQDANTFIYEAYKKCVVVSTIHRLPYEEFILKMVNDDPIKAKISNVHWDYVIFDEASMIPLPYAAYAIHQCHSKLENRGTEYWIGGDPLQIPPVVDIDDEDLPADFNKEENIYTMIGLQSFDVNEQSKIPVYGSKIENLKTQYRSIEAIGSLFSKFTYNSLLVHDRANRNDQTRNPRTLPGKFQKLGIKPVTLIKFPVNQDDSVYTPARLSKSPYQFYSAILVFEIIRHFENCISNDEHWTIGIVCPYRSQATLVNKMVESLDLKHNLSVITDTVHGFQGDECDVVFFIVNPPNHSISPPSYGAFIHKHYLINVAISRAKDYLVILYPDDNTLGINNLIKINKNNLGSIEDILIKSNINLSDITIQSSTIEEKLFNEKKHIENNIFTNKHQLVNVYNLAQKKYLVRESSTAIDIQFKS